MVNKVPALNWLSALRLDAGHPMLLQITYFNIGLSILELVVPSLQSDPVQPEQPCKA